MQNIKTKFNIKNFSKTEVLLLVIMSLLIGLSIGKILNTNTKQTDNINYIDNNVKEFIRNYNFIIDNYYEEVNKEKLINSAISGMMDSLDDPYSVYFNEEETENFSISLNGDYKGIGVQIIKDENTGYMLVTSVFENSPASTSGLQPGDMIISIGNTQAKDLSASEFSSLIRKGEDDEIILNILRDEKNLDIKITKEIVTLNSVSSKIIEKNDKKVGYIYIGIFANNTYYQFRDKLKELESENISHLIIDVRGNSGGHLTAVDKILDLFLNSNQIMYKFEQNNKKTSIYGSGNENKKYEIVLLGDENSASASEVLISSLKENYNSKFIGKKTYGKGTVQELVTLSDGTQYKITVKKWLTPKGNWINDSKGLTPDIEFELDKKYYETYEIEDDTQLQKAIEYIKEK